MTDVMSPEKRSALMARIKGSGTLIERQVARKLRERGHWPTQNAKKVRGCPDFSFYRAKLAVFLDGDFWHGYDFDRWAHKLAPFWRQKIESNRNRDRAITKDLRSAGWKVLRLWEHEIEKDLEGCCARIIEARHQ